MPVSLGAGDAETAVSQPQGRRREDARTKRRSGSALPAVRLLGRRTGARATGGSGSASTQPRGSERQEDAGVAGSWGRRDSGEPATGGPSCRASRKNACARKRTKRRSGSASPAARLLGRRTGARATGGPGSASTQPRGSERQEDAGVAGSWGRRDSGEPATGGPFLPCVTQERVREEENEEKERQRLASRKVARAKDGSASNRRARKCVDAAARVGAARRCRCRWGLGTPRQR